ncbi:molybdate transport repressor ModE-like protein [Kaistia hirudinis]|uniref:Molybdate transport repressor ModE-like protein n=1 Tax=Kaistia hirudinis TaxID=1293440 RepID=A0A840AJM5_9HYPH|nr:LysR family transcriptional regulator [Kaistia hirudinis]MBB3929598.1 molybdate transport repressor ModE-like protein [Kaistia hirudinis]
MVGYAKIRYMISMADRFRTDPDWDDLRVFCALARHGSLSATARALSVNHATIARRVAALEKTMGEKLVERRADGYVLTDNGRRVLEIATTMETAASALAGGLEGNAPAGLVRVAATPSLAQCFLIRRLGGFAAAHPRIDIEISTAMRSVSLDRHEADIALRLAQPLDGDLLARTLFAIGSAFYGTANWARRIAGGEPPVFVGFDEANAHLPEAVWLGRQFPRARLSMRTGSQISQAEAACSGCGIALLPHFLGRTATGLVRCDLGLTPPSRTLCLVVRRSDRRTPAIQLVADFLSACFSEERSLFEGA